MRMRHAVVALLLLAVFTAASAASSKVKIVNKSSWDIHELYLSSVDDDEWGPDQLGQHVIESGGSFTLTGIPCDEYDIQLVDEDGDQCVVGGVGLCGDRENWVITNNDLLQCQALTD